MACDADMASAGGSKTPVKQLILFDAAETRNSSHLWLRLCGGSPLVELWRPEFDTVLFNSFLEARRHPTTSPAPIGVHQLLDDGQLDTSDL